MALSVSKKLEKLVVVEAVDELDNGKLVTHKFNARFKVMPEKDWNELVKNPNVNRSDILDAVLLEIEDLKVEDENGSYDRLEDLSVDLGKDEDGNQILPKTPARNLIYNTPWVARALQESATLIHQGINTAEFKKAKAKN